MNPPIQFAVYAEYSDGKKEMAPGLNVRVFNRIEAQRGESILLDRETGAIHLRPGLYHITASSLVTYYDPAAVDQTKAIMVDSPPAGYCLLQTYGTPDHGSAEGALAIGTVCNADMIPSLIETYLTVKTETKIVLGHQIGADVAGVYLQVDAGGSTAHVFARIAIRRLQ